jgi:calcineurin-like phosphoesterase family protein
MKHVTSYFIGDMHFFHQKIYEPRGFSSVEEHNSELIKRWNSVVTPNDKVYVLGDFCFAGYSNLSIAEKLNGKKILILGNHDHYDMLEYRKYFYKIYGSLPYKNGLLMHMPPHECQLRRYKWIIHGHMHTHNIDDSRYVNVSAEQINLTPISFQDLVDKHKLIIKEPK